MSGITVVRPLWRSFTERWIANAAAHVRAGGQAMVWRKGPADPIAWMLLPCNDDGEVPELATWSMLALYKSRFEVIARGPAKGLAQMRIPRCYEHAVESWCERDSRWPGALREITLDCLACGSCCRRNRVVLEDSDVQRWKDAGRKDLAGRGYLRREGRVVLLKLARSGDCQHLAKDNTCGIYALRPDACSSFPVGSEPCLGAREDEMGVLE